MKVLLSYIKCVFCSSKEISVSDFLARFEKHSNIYRLVNFLCCRDFIRFLSNMGHEHFLAPGDSLERQICKYKLVLALDSN